MFTIPNKPTLETVLGALTRVRLFELGCVTGKATSSSKARSKKNGETKPTKRGRTKGPDPGDQGTLL